MIIRMKKLSAITASAAPRTRSHRIPDRGLFIPATSPSVRLTFVQADLDKAGPRRPKTKPLAVSPGDHDFAYNDFFNHAVVEPRRRIVQGMAPAASDDLQGVGSFSAAPRDFRRWQHRILRQVNLRINGTAPCRAVSTLRVPAAFHTKCRADRGCNDIAFTVSFRQSCMTQSEGFWYRPAVGAESAWRAASDISKRISISHP